MIEPLLDKIYARKLQEYGDMLKEYADLNYQKGGSFKFRHAGKVYNPYLLHSIASPQLHPSLRAGFEYHISTYHEVFDIEKPYVESLLKFLYSASPYKMHQILPEELHSFLRSYVEPVYTPYPPSVLELLHTTHAHGLELLQERLLLNSLGL